MHILDRIVEYKRNEVASLKARGLKAQEIEPGPKRGFRDALLEEDMVSIIAEVKRASPSKGLICKDFDPVRISKDYERGGASAVSVLTDREFFKGDIEFIPVIKNTVSLPLLRKDFIIDHIQVEEADIFGADAILLICAILDDILLKELLAHAKERSMDCLFEVHDEKEAERAILAGADLIGINNRNLKDFTVSLETTFRVRSMIPPEIPVVSESGIKTGDDIKRLKENHIQAALIGESLVRERDRVSKLREFIIR